MPLQIPYVNKLCSSSLSVSSVCIDDYNKLYLSRKLEIDYLGRIATPDLHTLPFSVHLRPGYG